MPLSIEQLSELLSLGKTAALNAAKTIKAKTGHSIETKLKESGSSLASQIVTEVDLASEKAILDVLLPTLEKYDLGLLTEENSEKRCRFSYDYFWCIDPLDGTLAFSRNEWGHSISIALVSKEGKAIIGVVYDNSAQALYWSVKNGGAYKDGKRFYLTSQRSKLTYLIDHSFKKENKKLHKDVEIHTPGGAVMNAIYTIEKAPAVYIKRPKQEDGGGSLWDFAATSLIQAEAGGYNSDYNRRPLNLNKKNTTFMNENGVIFASSKDLLDSIL